LNRHDLRLSVLFRPQVLSPRIGLSPSVGGFAFNQPRGQCWGHFLFVCRRYCQPLEVCASSTKCHSSSNKIGFSADLTLPIPKFCSSPFGSVCANLSARREYTILRNFESIIPAIPTRPPPRVAARLCDPVLNFLPFLTGLLGLRQKRLRAFRRRLLNARQKEISLAEDIQLGAPRI
jgi:hypothetical protein